MSKYSRVAVIDMGSNTIKVLVAQLSEQSQQIEPIYTSTKEARISSGIGSSDKLQLTEDSMTRGLGAVKELLGEIKEFSPDYIKIVATSAVRDAVNKEEYQELIESHTGHQLTVLSGSEEAQGIADGVLADPSVAAHDDFFIMDMGGGSLEVIEVENRIAKQFVSLPLGAVRVSEKILSDPKQPVQTDERIAIEKHAASVFSNEGFTPLAKRSLLVGAGGSFTIGRAILAERAGQTFDSFSTMINRSSFVALTNELSSQSFEQRIENKFIPPNRADIFPAALITLMQMSDILGTTDIIYSGYTLRFGIAKALLDEKAIVL